MKDCYKIGEFEIKHGPTDNMTADYFTKPLQRNNFFKFRYLMMKA